MATVSYTIVIYIQAKYIASSKKLWYHDESDAAFLVTQVRILVVLRRNHETEDTLVVYLEG